MRLSPATRVRIPPLGERPDDLEFLVGRFAERAVADRDIGVLVDLVAEAVGLSAGTQVNLVIGKGEKSDNRTGDELEIVLPEPAWRMLETHRWPGNVRELAMVVHNLLTFTLVGAVDALKNNVPLRTPRLQIDPGLVGELLSGSVVLCQPPPVGSAEGTAGQNLIPVRVEPGESLNAVANSVERQYFLALFKQTNGDFREMANRLVGDPGKSRAVRLRFNQLGLKVRELTRS
jgi:DNA-binding NtrC family response regulator